MASLGCRKMTSWIKRGSQDVNPGVDEVMVEPDEMLCLTRERCQEDMVTGVKDDSGGVMNDRCSKGAYYGGGTWWLDRWLLGRSDIVATHVREWDCGGKWHPGCRQRDNFTDIMNCSTQLE